MPASTSPPTCTSASRPLSTASTFLPGSPGSKKGRCRFGLDIEQLGDAQILIAALCHEIGHAFRTRHGLVKADWSREEDLTDLTTIYLGFGIFTVNASDRFEQTYSRPSPPRKRSRPIKNRVRSTTIASSR